MNEWSVRNKIIILTLLPTLIMALTLCSYFTVKRLNSIDANLKRHSTSIIKQFAPAVKFVLLEKKPELLQNLTNISLENHLVIATSIFNNAGELVAYSGPPQLRSSTVTAYQQHLNAKENNLVLLHPLIQQKIILNPSIFSQTSISNTDTPALGWLGIVVNTHEASLLKLETLFLTFLMFCLALVLSSLVAHYLGIQILKPLTRISRALSRVKQGDLETKIHEADGQEFKTLAKEINHIINDLKSSKSELNENRELIFKDLKHALEEMEIQNIELNVALKNSQRDSRRKSEFIASLSHEIRTPMSSIIGFTNLLLEADLTSFQKDYLNTISKSSNTLLAIINDILDFAKLESGKFKLENIPMEISEVVEEVLASLAPEAHQKNLDLIPLIDSHIPNQFIGDPLRIKQVITNLVFNAIKFTDEGGVTIKAELIATEPSKLTLQISVIDTGIGLSYKDQKNLFQAFSQGEHALRRLGGTGLGLVISKQLIEQMGGTIEIRSQLQLGTTIRFNINVKPIDANNDIESVGHKFIANKILAYEPHLLARQALRQTLEEKVNTISVIESIDKLKLKLSAAIEKGLPFEVVILSIHNDESRDKMIATEIQEVAAICQCPLIILVNSNDERIVKEIMQKGATLCIPKPISKKKLLQAIVNCLNKNLLVPIVKASNHTPLLPPAKSNLKILVAEDNPANIRLITTLLADLHAEVDTAVDGKKATILALENKYDLIMLDLQMPIMNGIETAKTIRQSPGLNQHTAIIAISAYIDEKDKPGIRQAGINETLIKPIDRKILQSLINKWSHGLEKSNSIVQDKIQADTSSQNNVDLKIIDSDMGIHLAGGNQKLAKELLEMFMNDLPKTRETIHLYYQQQNWAELTAILHKLHGSCSFCGIPRLNLITAEFERELKNANSTIYSALFDKLNYEIEAVLQCNVAT